MARNVLAANSSSAVAILAALLLTPAAGAQSRPIVLSIDRVLTHPVTGESSHEILPVAVFNGESFQPIREWDTVLGYSTRGPYLLTQYPIVQVLYHGERMGAVTVSDIRMQSFSCSALIVGTGDYDAITTLPASESSGSFQTGRRENGERVEFTTEVFLALSRSRDANDLEGGPVITAVTDSDELQSYTMEVDRIAPRPELLPLGIDETRAYRFNGKDFALVLRKRQSAATVALSDNWRIAGTLYTDAVIVREGPGVRSAFQLQGFPSERNGLGGGSTSYFIDAFALPNGSVYVAFQRYFSEAVNFGLYQLGGASETKRVFDTSLYGC